MRHPLETLRSDAPKPPASRARSVSGLSKLIDQFDAARVKLVTTDNAVDMTTANGRALIGVTAVSPSSKPRSRRSVPGRCISSSGGAVRGSAASRTGSGGTARASRSSPRSSTAWPKRRDATGLEQQLATTNANLSTRQHDVLDA